MDINIAKGIQFKTLPEDKRVDFLRDVAALFDKKTGKDSFKETFGYLYRKAIELGVLDEITSHMANRRAPYTKDELKDIAKRFSHKSQWEKEEGSSYKAALRIGGEFFDEVTSHMTPLGGTHKRMVYSYTFPNSRAAYVGLTNNEERRGREHKKDPKSPVYRYYMSTGKTKSEREVPNYQKITDGFVDAKEAQQIEHNEIRRLEAMGYHMLNVAVAGSLGGDNLIYDEEFLRDYLSKYEDIHHFYSDKTMKGKHLSMINSARKRKILDNVVPHDRWLKSFHTADSVMKYIEDNGISTIKELRDSSDSIRKAYYRLVKNGEIEDVLRKK
jgi:hypothetical protein